MPLATAPFRRIFAALILLVGLLAALPAKAAARGPGVDAAPPPPVTETPADERRRAEAALADLAPAEVRPLGRVERLWLRLSGGNPIFALDWLARGSEPEPDRLPLTLPLP